MKVLKTLLAVGIIIVTTTAQTIWNGSVDTDWYKKSATEFTISTAEELIGLASLVISGKDFTGKTIKLGKNIILNDTTNWKNWESEAPARKWTSIGTESSVFNGTFDGNGYIIAGVYINSSNNRQGLFGGVKSDGVIKNLGVVASYIKISSFQKNPFVGGLSAINSGTISNCYTIVNVTGYERVGGLVGHNSQIGTIIDSYSMGKVEGAVYVGGLAGSNEGNIKNCYASGNIIGGTPHNTQVMFTGGLVGVNSLDGKIINCNSTGNVKGNVGVGGLVGQVQKGEITHCYATGNIEGKVGLGGLIGIVREQSATINSSYATGNVSGVATSFIQDYNLIGGLIGFSIGSINNCYAMGKVKGIYNTGGLIGQNGGVVSNSYSTGKVEGASNNVGGLIGANHGSVTDENNKRVEFVGTITESYYDSQATEQSDLGKGLGKSTSKMKQKDTYSDWDFEHIWLIDAPKNNGYPYLR